MTVRQRQTLSCIGIAVVLIGIFAAELIQLPASPEVGDDDDSGDDDSGQFDHLPEAPKE